MNGKLLLGTLILCLAILVFALMYWRKAPEAPKAEKAPAAAVAERKIFVYFGPNACGKGTTAAKCAAEGFITISTGDLIRKHISEKTEIGKQVEEMVKKGELVPDALVIDMIRQWLASQKDSTAPIILDGFPRTRAQAAALLDLLNSGIVGPYKLTVVRFSISQDEAIKRTLYRVICGNKMCQRVYSTKDAQPKQAGICDICGNQLVHRPEDTEEIVKKRYQDYMANEGDVIKYLADKVSVKELNAEQPIEKVYSDFKSIAQNA